MKKCNNKYMLLPSKRSLTESDALKLRSCVTKLLKHNGGKPQQTTENKTVHLTRFLWF
uniref:Uncharacterized protein n=1 Tax=Anguilla anguilla TaxID=7936 RepID=A0A0E9S1F3_ANGAN